MAHKEKICGTALATHVQNCEQTYSYVPLLVPRRYILDADFPASEKGFGAIVRSELAEKTAAEIEAIEFEIPEAKDLALEIVKKTALNCKDSEVAVALQVELEEKIDSSLGVVREREITRAKAEVEAKVISAEGAEFDIANLPKALSLRAEKFLSEVDPEALKKSRFSPLPFVAYDEIPEIGIFNSEAVCLECEGLTFTACGVEKTVLPGEKLTESWSTEENSETETEAQNETEIITTDTLKTEQSQSLLQTFNEEVKKNTDLKFGSSFSLSGKLFKLLNGKASVSGNFDFNKMVSQANKSSAEDKRSFIHETVRKNRVFNALSTSTSLSTNFKQNWERVWENKTNCPQHYIERHGHYVYSVFHKWTNTQLGWSTCIDNPAEGLCTPENLEEMLAQKTQAIQDKWASAEVPIEFGTRPSNITVCSGTQYYSSNTGAKRYIPVGVTIPAGYSYAGSPTLTVSFASTSVQGSYITKQPGIGARGGVSFDTVVDLKNRVAHKEQAQYKVCFLATPDAASDWDAKVSVWRDQQAQTEIDALIAKENEGLKEFYASTRYHNKLKERLYRAKFGITDFTVNCQYLNKLDNLFDWDKMSVTFQPSWNAKDTGCANSDPVNGYTAAHALVFIPITENQELEALAFLVSIGAIPWSNNISQQVYAYINQINILRDTVFKRDFDPTGWEATIEAPLGYELTPYDWTGPNWQTAFEAQSQGAFQLLDAYVITVPGAGSRIEKRPSLCGDDCESCSCEDVPSSEPENEGEEE